MADSPVRTADEHCAILWQWLDLLVENGRDEEWLRDHSSLVPIIKHAIQIRLAIQKSSYLGRRLYGGEAHRTEPCPTHQGVWSGLPMTPDECACDLTGWLPAEAPDGN